MKIEMGESLIYSWLRHIRKCQIVQLNWKVSDSWNTQITDDLENLMTEIQNRFDKPFGDIKNLSQLVKFSEVDVIGFDFDEKILYGVDVAFHTYGLRYSDNVKNVTKKILRTLLVLDIYFDDDYHKKVIFSTPKINPKEFDKLMERMNELQLFIDEFDLKTTIEVISNDDFENEILNPILSLSNDVADTSELFLRSYQLTQLFDKKTTTTTSQSKVINEKHTIIKSDSISDEFNEIEKVKTKIPNWFQPNKQNQINSKILINFMKLSNYGNNSINLSLLERECNLDTFSTNYNQMKIISEKNHCKVFEEIDGFVSLWKPISDFVKSEYKKIQK